MSEILKNLLSYIQVKQLILLLSVSIALIQLSAINLMAQGNLVVFPRRLVFEGSRRSQELNIANTGSDTARYNISLLHYRMMENGAFEEITQPDSGENFADKYIRFFPRSVTLAPNESQVVKIQYMRTNQISPGEYRSHLYFRAEPNEKPLGEKEVSKDSASISIKLVPIFGITVPVIIRAGESTVTVSLSDLSFEMANDTIPTLQMAINRTGNMSVYGDIAVDHVSQQDKVTRVSFIQGVAVYTPNRIRRIKIEVDKNLDIDYNSGKLHVLYMSQSDSKPGNLAEAEMVLHK
jgi:P pilus assembly chaperone PapD